MQQVGGGGFPTAVQPDYRQQQQQAAQQESYQALRDRNAAPGSQSATASAQEPAAMPSAVDQEEGGGREAPPLESGGLDRGAPVAEAMPPKSMEPIVANGGAGAAQPPPSGGVPAGYSFFKPQGGGTTPTGSDAMRQDYEAQRFQRQTHAANEGGGGASPPARPEWMGQIVGGGSSFGNRAPALPTASVYGGAPPQQSQDQRFQRGQDQDQQYQHRAQQQEQQMRANQVRQLTAANGGAPVAPSPYSPMMAMGSAAEPQGSKQQQPVAPSSASWGAPAPATPPSARPAWHQQVGGNNNLFSRPAGMQPLEEEPGSFKSARLGS
jgi:hypothetical protein